MSDPARRHWTIEEFFAWQERQSERYELVDGFPLRMVVGARNVHDTIVVNVLGLLYNQLRGKPCRPFTGDGSVETMPGQIRRPDVGVDCGRSPPNDVKAALPRLVVEVLSPGTRDMDLFQKLEEYKCVASLIYILYIDPNAPDAALWTRRDGGEWVQRRYSSLDEVITLSALALMLPMAEVYERVGFPPQATA